MAGVRRRDCINGALGLPLWGFGAARSLAATPKVLVLGDSLSAEYGLRRGSGWVALLEERLHKQGLAAQVVNASVSGDTSAGGRSRLPALLARHNPSVVLIELGGNDALRGLPLTMTEANLTEMVRRAKSHGAKVMLAGVQVPPNYGQRYAEDFAKLFSTVANAEGAPLVPSLLKGVDDAPNADALFQPDRIHPNEAAQATLLDNVWPVLRPMVR